MLFFILATNKKVFVLPGGEFYQKFFSASEDPRYAEIGQNRFIIPTTWDHHDQLLDQVFSKNDVVFLQNSISSSDKEKGNWYRSDETIT